MNGALVMQCTLSSREVAGGIPGSPFLTSEYYLVQCGYGLFVVVLRLLNRLVSLFGVIYWQHITAPHAVNCRWVTPLWFYGLR